MRSLSRIEALARAVGLRFVAGSLAVALLASPAAAQIDVWIDPGHGGTDPGNIGFGGTQEKNVTLEVAAHLYSRLGQIGYSSLITRSSDSYPTLDQRSRIANGDAPNDGNEQEECQILISVHMNAPKGGAADGVPFGTETFYSPRKVVLRKKDAFRADSNLANVVHPRLMTGAAAAFLGCNRDRGVKAARHYVTRMCERPSILVEVCFITNQCQRDNIIQNGDQALIANGIAAGVSFAISPGGPVPHDATSTVDESEAAALPAILGGRAMPWPRNAEGALSYSEGFEGGAFPPDGWTMTTIGLADPYRWHRSTDGLYVNSGIGAALVGGASPGAVDEWLISPMVFVGPADQGFRFYWSGNETFAVAVNAEALVRPKDAGTWTSVWSLLNEPAGAEFDYRERVASLASWVGDSVQVAFRVSGIDGADFSIDDVSIGDFAPTSAPPNDLCANASPMPAGTFTLSGTTCYAANDSDPHDPDGTSCSIEPLGAGDVFYSLNAQAGDTLTLELNGPSFPVAYLLSSCDTASATCLASTPALQTATGDTTGFQHIFASNGTYYLVVDALTGDCGAYQLAGTFRGAVTGVGDNSRPSGLSLAAWPNPARSGIHLVGRFPDGLRGPGRLQVFDLAGRVLLDLEVAVGGGRFEAFWDGRSNGSGRVAAGVYVARFVVGGQATSARVVVAE